MKKIIFIFCISSNLGMAQSKLAVTEEGRQVLLRANNTWEYVDVDVKSASKSVGGTCDLAPDYSEPKPDKSIQSFLKRGDATIEDLRKHIAVENECGVNEVKFLRISEQKGNGMYSACVKGKEMKYRRIGSAFLKADEDPFKK